MIKPNIILIAIVALGACKEHEFQPPDKAARVEAAKQQYAPVMFDTIQWASADERLTEGNNVYASKCRKCHGADGTGVTEYAQMHKLEPPSLVTADWKYAASVDSVRHRIYVGHASGMPTFGVAGLTPREIDAAAHYVLEQLRPDMLRARPTP